MKILIVSWKDMKHPKSGGAELVVYEHTKYLIDKGHDVTWFCQRFSGSKKTESYDKIKIIRRGKTIPSLVLSYLLYDKSGFDAIIENNSAFPFFSPVSKRVVVVHHIYEKNIFLELNIFAGTVFYAMENWLTPLFYKNSKIIAVSESTANVLKRKGYKNVEVIYNGLDHSRYYDRGYKKESVPHLIYIGGIKRYKRIDYLIDVLRIVKKKIPNIHLNLVGSLEFINNKNVFMDKVVSYGLKKNVTFHGFVSEEKKLRLINKADVFVIASSVEGFGLVVIEANACGLPAVATDVAGLRDSVHNNYNGFLAENKKDFAAKVLRLLMDRKLYKRLSKNSTRWAKEFTWEKHCKKVYTLIKATAKPK